MLGYYELAKAKGILVLITCLYWGLEGLQEGDFCAVSTGSVLGKNEITVGEYEGDVGEVLVAAVFEALPPP